MPVHTTIKITRELTEKDLNSFGREMLALNAKIEDTKRIKSGANAIWNKKIKELQQLIKIKSTNAQKALVEEDRECFVMNYEELGVRKFIDINTEEILKTEPLDGMFKKEIND